MYLCVFLKYTFKKQNTTSALKGLFWVYFGFKMIDINQYKWGLEISKHIFGWRESLIKVSLNLTMAAIHNYCFAHNIKHT